MPSHVVKIPFPYAGDGFTVEHLKVGESRDFGMSAEGLLSEGLIEVGEDAVPVKSEPDAFSGAEQVEPQLRRVKQSRNR